MTAQQQRDLRTLEGRRVNVALADGRRFDDVALVSARGTKLWIFDGGEDTFVPAADVLEVWEAQPTYAAA